MITITLIAPQEHLDAANALTGLLGTSAQDAQAIPHAAWRCGAGRMYGLASGQVAQERFEALQAALADPSELELPDWGGDAPAIRAALGLVEMQDTTLAPDRITLTPDLPAQIVIALAGLEYVGSG